MKKLFALLLVLSIWTLPIFAQAASSGMVANAQIQTTIFAETIQNIELGALVPGTTTTIQPQDALAGQFNITSSNNNTRFNYAITNTPLTHTATGAFFCFLIFILAGKRKPLPLGGGSSNKLNIYNL
jgi:hypothetical protein